VNQRLANSPKTNPDNIDAHATIFEKRLTELNVATRTINSILPKNNKEIRINPTRVISATLVAISSLFLLNFES
jgi:hypothetical protein